MHLEARLDAECRRLVMLHNNDKHSAMLNRGILFLSRIKLLHVADAEPILNCVHNNRGWRETILTQDSTHEVKKQNDCLIYI